MDKLIDLNTYPVSKNLMVIMKWQQIGNRKSASQNNICNRDKITAETR